MIDELRIKIIETYSRLEYDYLLAVKTFEVINEIYNSNCKNKKELVKKEKEKIEMIVASCKSYTNIFNAMKEQFNEYMEFVIQTNKNLDRANSFSNRLKEVSDIINNYTTGNTRKDEGKIIRELKNMEKYIQKHLLKRKH